MTSGLAAWNPYERYSGPEKVREATLSVRVNRQDSEKRKEGSLVPSDLILNLHRSPPFALVEQLSPKRCSSHTRNVDIDRGDLVTILPLGSFKSEVCIC
jgi:hypothetical protein